MCISRMHFQNWSVSIVLHKLALGELLRQAQLTKYDEGCNVPCEDSVMVLCLSVPEIMVKSGSLVFTEAFKSFTEIDFKSEASTLPYIRLLEKEDTSSPKPPISINNVGNYFQFL